MFINTVSLVTLTILDNLGADNFLDLSTDHLQHDQFAGSELIAQGNDGSFIMRHVDIEDINPTVEHAHLSSVLHPPESDRSVCRARNYDLVVTRNGRAPNLLY